MVSENLKAAILDVEAALEQEKKGHGQRIAALNAKKQSLLKLQKDLDSKVEDIILTLGEMGLL